MKTVSTTITDLDKGTIVTLDATTKTAAEIPLKSPSAASWRQRDSPARSNCRFTKESVPRMIVRGNSARSFQISV